MFQAIEMQPLARQFKTHETTRHLGRILLKAAPSAVHGKAGLKMSLFAEENWKREKLNIIKWACQ